MRERAWLDPGLALRALPARRPDVLSRRRRIVGLPRRVGVVSRLGFASVVVPRNANGWALAPAAVQPGLLMPEAHRRHRPTSPAQTWARLSPERLGKSSNAPGPGGCRPGRTWIWLGYAAGCGPISRPNLPNASERPTTERPTARAANSRRAQQAERLTAEQVQPARARPRLSPRLGGPWPRHQARGQSAASHPPRPSRPVCRTWRAAVDRPGR